MLEMRKSWHADMNAETARPASSTDRQVRYQRRRSLRQARVTVWIDRADVAFLDSIPVNRSDLIRGLVGMARRGQVDLPTRPARRGLASRIAGLLGVGTVRKTAQDEAGGHKSPYPGAPEAGNGQMALTGDPRAVQADFDGPAYLEDPEPRDLAPEDLSDSDQDLTPAVAIRPQE